MQLILAAVLGGLISIMSTLTGRVLMALGMYAVVFTGVNESLLWIRARVESELGGVVGDFVQVVAALKVDVAISILLSAVVARMTFRGMFNGALVRWVFRGGAE